MENEKKYKVLIVDDDPSIRTFASRSLRGEMWQGNIHNNI